MSAALRSARAADADEGLGHAFSALVGLHTGDPTRSLASVEAGLLISEKSDLSTLEPLLRALGVFACLSRGDVRRATELGRLAGLAPGDPFGEAMFHYSAGWVSLLSGDAGAALARFDQAIVSGAETEFVIGEGMSRAARVIVDLHTSDVGSASQGMVELESLHRRAPSNYLKALSMISRASLAERKCDRHAGAPLDAALRFLQRAGYRSVPGLVHPPKTLGRLLGRAVESSTVGDVSRCLIQGHGLSLYPPSVDIEQWPWILRITTLDTFSLFDCGTPVRFATKAQRRPLELLKVVIALGGRDVPESRIVDALWPDGEADAGAQALKITLHRLRKMLSPKVNIELRGHAITLDTRCAWVDAWAFERRIAHSRLLSGEARAVELGRALSLYRGTFLSDEDAPWATPARERFRAQFVARLVELCEYWLSTGELDRIEELCHRGLDAEPLAEPIYLALMKFYAATGRKSAARAVYLRCERTLRAVIDLPPSSDLKHFYAAFVVGGGLPETGMVRREAG